VGETRIVLEDCGVIDPHDIATYLERGGFEALKKARKTTPEEVIAEVSASGLKGRGGAGFPCGVKWAMARKSPGDEKYLICNADEGEVGTFKDRYIIAHNPFGLLEGMAIASFAIGAKTAYIYLRDEYQYLRETITVAMEQVKGKGLLEDLVIEIQEGAGAYICGEESALMNSIEGRRGEARCRPPYPPSEGLWGKPTIINNVETLMNLPPIIARGGAWFSEIGTKESKGTKVFSVSGDVQRPGVYELAMGYRLSELVTDLAGAEDIQLVQVGGATGAIIPASLMDTPLSYETILGSGAITVFNHKRDVIDIVYRTLLFLNEESCGKCAPCREGTEVMVEIFERLTKGEGLAEDVEVLEQLSDVMALSSLCGLGQGAPVPVLDTLKHFRSHYETRIKQSVYLRTLRGLH
jgi:NADH:ubiquinone oxidoreductase subunit F (NADH-binding)